MSTRKETKKHIGEMSLNCMPTRLLLFIIGLVCTIGSTAASSSSNPASESFISRLERTLNTLTHGNIFNEYSIRKVLRNFSSNIDSNQVEPINLGDITINLENYIEMEELLHDFDDSIVYKSITIEGYPRNFNNYKDKNQQDLCMRFIKALGNLQADELILEDVPGENIKDLNEFIGARENESKKKSTIKQIVCRNVCNDLLLRIIGQYSFADTFKLIFQDEDPKDWDLLLNITSLTTRYNVIEVENIKPLNLPLTKPWMIRRIARSLCIRAFSKSENAKFLSEIQDLTNEQNNTTLEKTTVRIFEQLMKRHSKYAMPINSGRLELLAESPDDFNEKQSTEVQKITTEEYDKYIENEEKAITRLAKHINSHFVRKNPNSRLHLDIKFVKRTVLTLPLLKRILLWVAVHKNNTTSLSISNLAMSDKGVEIFEGLKVQVNSMPHLDYIVLQNVNSEDFIQISLRNIDNSSASIRNRIELDFKEKAFLIVPLNMYIQKDIFQTVDKEEKQVYSIKYPSQEQDENELNICCGCMQDVFTVKGDEENGYKSTSTILSLKEIKDMTWSQFEKSDNKQNIEAHLKDFYDLKKDADFEITEQNFREVVEYVIDKPIVSFNRCKHTLCVNCVDNLLDSKEVNKSFIRGFLLRYKMIECPSCRDYSGIAEDEFVYFVRIKNTENMEDKFIYSLQSFDIDGYKYQYVPYKCIPFKTNSHHIRNLTNLVKPNFVITEEEVTKEKSS